MSLFITSNILSINMLYVETVSSLMYDVSRLSVPSNISVISSLTFIKYMYAPGAPSLRATFILNLRV